MAHIDLLVHSAEQLCVVPPGADGGPQRGTGLGDLGLISGGAVAIRDGLVAAVGSTAELRRAYTADDEVDAAGCVVCPGRPGRR